MLLDLFTIAILIYSVVLHEVAHGLMARALGDDTAERLGRLTLNPLKHLDLFGSFLLPMLTKLIGGFMFGYAKPVPYDPHRLSNRRWEPVMVGLAGPGMNLLIAAIFGLGIRFLPIVLSPVAVSLMASVVLVNLGLAAFNLMPIPPLDGHWLLMALLPSGSSALKMTLYRNQWLLLFVAMFVLFPLLLPLVNGFFRALTGL